MSSETKFVKNGEYQGDASSRLDLKEDISSKENEKLPDIGEMSLENGISSRVEHGKIE